MEFKYKNEFEDIRILVEYLAIKEKISKTFLTFGKIITLIIPIILGVIYESPKVITFFIGPIVAIWAVFILLPRILQKVILKKTKQLYNENYYSSERRIIINNKELIIYCNDEKTLINLKSDVTIDDVGEYILIVPHFGFSYKNKLVIPKKIFSNINEVNILLNEIK